MLALDDTAGTDGGPNGSVAGVGGTLGTITGTDGATDEAAGVNGVEAGGSSGDEGIGRAVYPFSRIQTRNASKRAAGR